MNHFGAVANELGHVRSIRELKFEVVYRIGAPDEGCIMPRTAIDETTAAVARIELIVAASADQPVLAGEAVEQVVRIVATKNVVKAPCDNVLDARERVAAVAGGGACLKVDNHGDTGNVVVRR